MRQNRRHARKESIGRVKVSWKMAGRGQTEWGMIQDRSEGGLGVKIPKPINADSIIAIVQGFSTTFGVVRHCTKVGGHFFIGVEFCAVEEPSKQPSAGAVAAAETSASSKDPEKPATGEQGSSAGSEGGLAVTGAPPVPAHAPSSSKALRSWE